MICTRCTNDMLILYNTLYLVSYLYWIRGTIGDGIGYRRIKLVWQSYLFYVPL